MTESALSAADNPSDETLEGDEFVDTAPSGVADPVALLHKIVHLCVTNNGSDIHMRSATPPAVRINGTLRPITDSPVLTPGDMEMLAENIMTPRHWAEFKENFQADFSIGVKGVGRLRVNAYLQRGTVAMALRVINSNVPTPLDLGLPNQIMGFTELERGLVLLTGATGSGKSTTIAAMLNEINTRFAKHIITIEDPIEYLFREEKSIISQRELGVDAMSFALAMKAALREDPDVILLGEMRDPETIETALTAAETGHLVYSTVHAPTTADTITRVVSTFSPEMQPTIRAKLSQNLQAVISQRLVKTADGKGRTVACEILTTSQRVRELMLDPMSIKDIADLVKQGETVEGMLSFDHHLLQLVQSGKITDEEALKNASSQTDMRLLLQGFGS